MSAGAHTLTAVPLAGRALELHLLGLVEAELAAELARRDRTRLRVEDQEWVYELVGRVVGEQHREVEESERLWRLIFASVTPLGPLAEHLADPEVEEVRINGTDACFVFRGGRRQSIAPPFSDESALVELVHWYTDGTPTARLDRASPMVTMTLPEGSRLHAALSPPAWPMSVTIRRHPPARFSDLSALEASGFMPAAVCGLIEAAVGGRLNILISGGAGAGKTTFMRVIARLTGADERVVTIEDQAELHLWRELPDCVALEGRPPIGSPVWVGKIKSSVVRHFEDGIAVEFAVTQTRESVEANFA